MNYELCHPKCVNKEEVRIFNKNNHNCNIGNSSKITHSILTQILNEWKPDYMNSGKT